MELDKLMNGIKVKLNKDIKNINEVKSLVNKRLEIFISCAIEQNVSTAKNR